MHTVLCKYFVLSFLCVNVLLSFAIETFAFPLTGHVGRQGMSSTTPEPTSAPNTTNEIQSIETTQSSTSADGITIQRCTIIGTPTTLANGESAVIITQNCSSTFIPSTHSSTTSAESISHITLSLPSSVPPSSTSSAFSTSAIFTSVPPLAPSITNSVSGSFSSPTPSSTSSSIFNTSVNASANAPASVTNNGASGGHLSSLPIFLGAFGGVATLALIIVACTVYRPSKYFNSMRSNPPACIKRIKRKVSRKSDFSFDGPEKQVDSPAMYPLKTS